MKKIVLFWLTLCLLVGQSMNANLTLYKNGYTMVKQPAFWNISKGQSQITYSLFPNQLFPETPFLSLMNGVEIMSQRLNRNIFSSDSYFKSRIGNMVEAYPEGEKSVYGQLIEFNSKSITIQSKSWVKMIPRDELTILAIKEKVEDVQFRPKLEWDIKANHSGHINGDILYMTGGIEWKSVYRLITSPNKESAILVSEALIFNDTDLNFEESRLKLIEGDLHKTSSYRPILYGPKMAQSMRTQDESLTQQKMEEAPLGDYYVYSIEYNVSLIPGETVTLTLYSPRDILFKKTYIFENRERQKKEEPLTVELEIANTEKNNLSIPLPAGKVEIYLETSEGNIEFIGEDNIKQIPKGEKAKLIAGRAFDIIGKRKIINYDRQRKSEEASIKVEILNKKDQSAQVKIIEHISGDWVIKDSNKQWIKEDAATIYFSLTIPPGESDIILYTYKKEWK